jgi:hypothetical protein
VGATGGEIRTIMLQERLLTLEFRNSSLFAAADIPAVPATKASNPVQIVLFCRG